MNYHFQAQANAASTTSDCIVIGIYEDKQLTTAAQHIEQASQGAIQQFMSLGDFQGKKDQVHTLYHLPGVSAQRVMLIGMGQHSKLTQNYLNQLHQTAIKQLSKNPVQHVTSFLSDESATTYRDQAVRQAVIAMINATYEFNAFKSEAEASPSTLSDWTIAHTSSQDHSPQVTQGQAIGEGMRLARDLGNMPPNVCTPTYLAETAQQIADQSDKVSLEVLEEADMEQLGMGAFLSVSKGSVEPGKMVVLQYHGAGDDSAPVALVGKGITFDTGGISLKPGAAMDEMKFDMCGAASAMGSFKACVEMNLPLNLVTILTAAENMPAGNASKPGDIVTSMSGKTIEILNTDAEGRLVLCDALTYVERFNPAAVVDIATLTGACITALGRHTSGLLSNNDKLAHEVLSAAEKAEDASWRLPMGDQYQEQLKSNFADMANIGGAPAGTITAACFLSRFTEQYPWVHLDIAGVAWHSGANKGSTGRPVPLLTQWLLDRASQ